jgi:predicted phage terminase large subunit-like protein
LWYDEKFFTKRNFLEVIAKGFQKIYDGKIKTLSVSMPPRAGKSYITTLFCAWVLGKKNTESVMRNTCTSTLYDKFSYDVRTVVKSRKYQAVFRDAILSVDKQNLSGWRLKDSKQVAYFGAGVGGTIIGFGASALAITDDLYKSLEDALSETVNEKVHSWKASAHDSRLETNCPSIDIGTRWSKNDVIGTNIRLNRYDESIVVPALINEKSFCEDVKSTDEYLKIRDEIDTLIWSAEYQQEPVESKTVLFNINELNYYKPSELLQFESSIAYIDVADEGNDYLSAVVGKNIGDKCYITDVVFSNANADETLPECARLIQRNDVRYCRVESNSMGAMFSRNLQNLVPDCNVLTAHSSTNKHTRIIMDAGFIKKHFYFVHKENQTHEYRQFMEQLCSYSRLAKSKHDDAPDSLSGLAILLRAMLGSLYS